MSLYRYTGDPGRIWPTVPVTPEVGDVVEWGEVVPDALAWTPVAKAAKVRDADNTDGPAPADAPSIDAPADVPTTQE